MEQWNGVGLQYHAGMRVIEVVNRFLSRLFVALSVVALAAAFWSCSPKKNTAATRNYQAFITRYNVYFNGDEHYKETLKEMERNYEDDYTTTLFLHPAEARANPKAPQPSGSFTRSIEKAQKAIQLHSIKKRPRRKPGKGNDPEYKKWLKRDEYNPFLHNAWMMMGRSQYMDGDFLGAASTFYYVAKHFSWLPETVTEARLWQARCYCALDWLFEAETILKRVKQDDLATSTLKGLYYFTYADYCVRSHDNKRAVEMLGEAVRYAKGAQKTRLRFLLGQVNALTGNKKGAYEAFRKVGASSSAPYRTRFNARIKQSEVFEGADISSEVKSLRRMTRYGANKEFLDQIYYAIGNLYLSRRDTANAIANYVLAAENSTRNGIDKAISQVTLGGLYYDQGRYDLAQPRYAESVPQLPESYPDYARIKRRSDVLDELAVYSQNVVLNDSLLRLAAMSEEERLDVINRIIKELEKKEKEAADEARREEYMAQQEAGGSILNNSNASAPTQFQLNTDKSWYFYNTATRNAGRTDFQKRWGSRKLEDDWRRRNKSSFSMGTPSEEETDEAVESEVEGEAADTEEDKKEKEAREREQDPHYPEYYLRQIPNTDAEKTVAGEVIQEGLYNSGLILKDKLEDFDAADAEWGRLMDRYPENVYRLDIYYNQYLMNMRRSRPGEAETYRALIIKEFPESKYAAAMRDPAYLDKLRSMEARQEALYEQAYEDYLSDRNTAVHEAYSQMEKDYPLSPIMPKFMFLHALAYVTENRSKEFGETIADLLKRYPEADIAPLASEWLKGVKAGRELHSGGSNTRSMLWDIRLSNDSTALAGGGGDIEFTLAPEEPHYLVLLFSTDAVTPNSLLYEVARHNFSTYVVKDFDLELMNFGPLGLLIVKGFANQAELNHYRSLLARDGTFTMPEAVRPVEISKSNFDKLLQGAGSFDDYFRFTGEEAVRKAEAIEEGDVAGTVDAGQDAGAVINETDGKDAEAEKTEDAGNDMISGSPSEADSQPTVSPIESEKPETIETPEPAPKPDVPVPNPNPLPSSPAVIEQPLLPEYPVGSEGDEED